MAKPLNAVVVGAGAVGLALGSCLLRAEQRVRFVARGGTRTALEREGLLRSGLFGEVRHAPHSFEVVESLAALAPEPVDCVLVCTKTTASAAVAAELEAASRSIPVHAAVVLFQNGWGSAEILAERLGAPRVYNARVITGFRRPAPSQVEVTVHAEPIRIGSLFGADLAPVARLAAAIDAGGIPCELSPEIARDLWAKMLYNCALNPLGALLEVPYGALAEREPTRELLRAVVAEVFAVLGKAGWRTHWPDAPTYLEAFFTRILPPTARHESSMLQDIRAGRPTEIDALSGAVAKLGGELGVATPVNAALATLVRATAARRRPPLSSGR